MRIVLLGKDGHHAFLDNIKYIEIKEHSFYCTVHVKTGDKLRKYLYNEYKIESIHQQEIKE